MTGESDHPASGPSREVATLGGGCFWCLEAVFNRLRGVERVESGYSGGNSVNPTYQEICTGATGHAEVVQITFDPKAVSFDEILEVFFTIHDPTTLNRQGADMGSQYRSVIFYHNPEQKTAAERVIKEVGPHWQRPIVTEIVPFKAFYKAEAYHQEYYERYPDQPYCQAVIDPKVSKFRQKFLAKIKDPT
jgi:peptide-methionine (S)-S-oxide reductase